MKANDVQFNKPDSNLNYIIQLVKNLTRKEQVHLAGILEEEIESADNPVAETQFASEQVLKKDWMSPAEDEAWKDL